jgi:hypothetical protein
MKKTSLSKQWSVRSAQIQRVKHQHQQMQLVQSIPGVNFGFGRAPTRISLVPSPIGIEATKQMQAARKSKPEFDHIKVRSYARLRLDGDKVTGCFQKSCSVI